ncbi:hypothetical protein IKT18_02275 [Candidatus Saccharibacteria bacterium]|nr:hypothetical protein [Candidatus Saccharibacteria bacterium]
MNYFGFAVADSMFSKLGNCSIRRTTLTADSVREMAAQGKLTPCLNPSHIATISAMRQRFNINLGIPEKPPIVSLDHGDSVIVMSVRGLPRLTDRHEYTPEEVAAASFEFAMYSV